jgi:dTDP-4-amino-4,6-dideoxygalactose transaminase
MYITKRTTFLPFALPTIGEEEIAEVADSLRSGWITTGPKVQRFEADFAAYIGCQHAIAVASCTAGLHLALTALGVGPGDEVIVPTMTFCSTANVVVHAGARPVLVDVGEDGNVLPAAVEAAVGPRTRAIMPVHFAGQPCQIDEIYRIAARHDLAVIEDAAHAVGAAFQGHKVGSEALLSACHPGGLAARAITVFSFYATKNMTTGEGGMITTADDQLAAEMRLLALHGMSRDAWKRYTSAGSWYYEVVAPGFKYNMTDLQAAIGIHQLGKLDAFITRRQGHARRYDRAFAGLEAVTSPPVHPDRSHIYHLYAVQLDLDRLSIDRARFITELKERNIGASVHFIPVHLHPFYKSLGYRPGDFPRSEKLYERIVSLPLYPRMTERDLDDVIGAVSEIVRCYPRWSAMFMSRDQVRGSSHAPA